MRYVYGYHAIEESVKKYPQGTLLAAARLGERAEKIKTAALEQGVKVKTVDESELKRLSGITDCKGLLYRCENKKESFTSLSDFLKSIQKRDEAVVFILDSITDPHNFGAVLRSADQFDIDLVMTRSKRSSRENNTVAVTSAGAVNHVNTLTVANLNTAIDELKENGFWVYGADLHGMGSEGKGISRLTAEKCDGTVTVPTSGNIDSLNVSVAAGILMYEIRRRKITL